MFFRPTGTAADTLSHIKKSKALKRCRIQTRGKGECDKLVIGIGQVHPILSGTFERFQARRIANVQAEIYALCSFFHSHYDVASFGQEGYSGAGHARFDAGMLTELKEAAKDPRGVKPVLKTIAARWRKSLRKGNQEKIATYSTALNGLALLQALEQNVAMFPIEQRDVHSAIGQTLDRLTKELKHIESSSAYRSASSKGGKGLTKEEYGVVLQRNKVIKQFNKTISHPERDRSILRQVLKHATDEVTVFVLGTGHRSGMLTLASKTLPEGYLFAWVTPPALWWMKSLTRKIGWILIVGIGVLMVVSLR